MTRPQHQKLKDSGYRSPKRRKLAAPSSKYSTRAISWEEQLRLPDRFHEEEGVWPVSSILNERGAGERKEYLLEWESHPDTGEVFEPTWVSKANVGAELVQAWQTSSRTLSSIREEIPRSPEALRTTDTNTSHGLTAGARPGQNRKRRRVIQDSSSDLISEAGVAESRTPTLASSPSSSLGEQLESETPAIEILETQQPWKRRSISVNIPTADINQTDYESIHGSQYSLQDSSSQDISYSFDVSFPGEISQSVINTYQANECYSRSVSLQARASSINSAHKTLSDIIASSTTEAHFNRLNPNSSTSPRASTSTGQSSTPFISESIAVSPLDSEQNTQDSASQINGQHLAQQSRPVNHSLRITRSQLSGIDSPSQRRSSPRLQKSPSQTRVPDRPSLSSQSLIELSQVLTLSPVWKFQTQDPNYVDDTEYKRLRQIDARLPASNKPHSQLRNSANHNQAPQNSLLPLQDSSPRPYAQQTAMSGPVTRQSPRPRSAVPVSNVHTAELSAKDRVRRPRANQEPMFATTSPLAREPMSPQYNAIPGVHATADEVEDSQPMQRSDTMNTDQAELNLPTGSRSLSSAYDTIAEPSLSIQQSIEEEPMSSAEERNSIASKASSSQQSLENERLVPQVDGITLPVRPILGPAEFTIALPAEGKVQSTYTDTLKAKRKTVLKFINRRDSIGSASGSTTRTIERNEMIELIQRLHDTTTHLDLGLPGFATQYSIRSEEASAYANYAGSKFAFLGHLIDVLSRVDCSMVIVAQSGPVQDLLEEYLIMKHVSVRRHDRPASLKAAKLDPSQVLVKVDLVSTAPTSELGLNSRPLMIIAFDCSFDNQEPHINRIRELNSTGRNHLLPVVHLLVTNSSEHIDRCLRKSMPSPQRLKLLVRGAYQARKFLGGQPTYVPHPSDEPDGRPMDLSDLQRAVRKSPERKLAMVANIVARAAITEDFDNHWTFGEMSDVQYADLDENMPKLSQTSTAVHSAVPTPRGGRARSRTPISRAGTPSAKKRFLEVESTVPSLVKRQRLTPLRDIEVAPEPPNEQRSEIEVLRQTLQRLQGELQAEKEARKKAVDAQLYMQKRLGEVTSSLADLQHRYEKRMKKTHDLDKINKALTATIEIAKGRQEKSTKDNLTLKGQIGQLQSDLITARSDLTTAGGDVAILALAKEEARAAVAKSQASDKSLENMKKDFEFTRQQYQQASNRAAELGVQNSELEAEITDLKGQAGEEKRKLKHMSLEGSTKQHMAKIAQLELEKKRHLMLLRKMEEEIKLLKKNRGVQTRGSSVQPSSPGQRSRQGSPASGMLLPPSAHSGNRASVLRHER